MHERVRRVEAGWGELRRAEASRDALSCHIANDNKIISPPQWQSSDLRQHTREYSNMKDLSILLRRKKEADRLMKKMRGEIGCDTRGRWINGLAFLWFDEY